METMALAAGMKLDLGKQERADRAGVIDEHAALKSLDLKKKGPLARPF